jgi:CDP-glycerol glycerophosphotransferase (TagB/SpsB family)
VLFDYLHLDRPIVLFRPDHRDYTERSRRLFDEKLSVLPGTMVDSANALLSLLARPLDPGRHADARRELLDRLYDHRDGRSGERLGDLLAQELDRALA